MLYTLNQAWASILIAEVSNGTIPSALFVCYNEKEREYYQEMIKRNPNVEGCVECVTAECIRERMRTRGTEKKYGDILLSYKLSDPMMNNYLSKLNMRIHP